MFFVRSTFYVSTYKEAAQDRIVILFVCMSKDVDFKLRSGSVAAVGYSQRWGEVNERMINKNNN